MFPKAQFLSFLVLAYLVKVNKQHDHINMPCCCLFACGCLCTITCLLICQLQKLFQNFTVVGRLRLKAATTQGKMSNRFLRLKIIIVALVLLLGSLRATAKVTFNSTTTVSLANNAADVITCEWTRITRCSDTTER